MVIRRGFVVLFLIFVTLGIYYPSIFAGANSVDDLQMITAYFNTDRFDLKELFLPGSSGYYYRPLLGLTFIFDKIVWGLNESFMHLDNVIFHVVNVVLVFFISVKVARRYSIEDKLLPMCAALLFAVHPINTESVNWISGRTDLLAGIFVLLAILLLLNALQNENLLWGASAAVAFLLGCFAKEVAVSALPGLLFLVVFYDSQGSLLQRLRKRWVCFIFLTATATAYFVFRYLALISGDTGIKAATTAINAPTSNLLNTIRVSLKVYGFYLKKIFIPWPLNFAIVRISDYYVIAGVILILAIVYMLYKRSLISALLLTSISLTAPALLVALARLAWTPLAERYLYIPCATFSIAMAVLVYKYFFLDNPQFRRSLCLIVTLLFASSAYATVNRNVVWQNNITLFQDTLLKSPGFYLAQNALASALLQGCRDEEARTLMLSMAAPQGSKEGRKIVDSNRAAILADEGDLSGAKKLLLRNIEVSGVFFPDIVERIITINMSLLREEHDLLKARELRQEILGLLLKMQAKSGDPFYYYRIGQFHLNFMGDKSAAQRCFSEAYLRSPDGTHYKQAAKKLAENLKQ